MVDNFIGHEELMDIKDTPLGKEILKNSRKATNYYGYIMPFITALRYEIQCWCGGILNTTNKEE